MIRVVVATRLSLLLVLTVLFAGMWSSDSSKRRMSGAQLARRTTPSIAGMLAKSQRRPCPEAPEHNGTKTVNANPNDVLPLPPGITNGTYMVVDQNGATRKVVVSLPHGQNNNKDLIDQYVLRTKEVRYHFIRLQETDHQSASVQRSETAATLH